MVGVRLQHPGKGFCFRAGFAPLIDLRSTLQTVRSFTLIPRFSEREFCEAVPVLSKHCTMFAMIVAHGYKNHHEPQSGDIIGFGIIDRPGSILPPMICL